MSNVRGSVHTDDIGYSTKLEPDGSGNPLYIGLAVPGTLTSDPLWQIRKLIWNSGFPTDIQFANGSRSFNAIWDNRAALSYS